MMNDVQELLDQYWAWVKDKTTLRQVNDWLEITTPHLDRHNDYLQIYIKSHESGFTLSDNGYILDDLEMSGCGIDMSKPSKRRTLLDMTLNGFGIRRNENRLEVSASPDNFPVRKHNLVQAMLAVNDLFYLATPWVSSLFYEDVVAWLDHTDIRYTPTIKLSGRSGYDHVFDFVIPKSREQPERVVKAINQPNRQTVQSLVFAWSDTKENRTPESRAYALLNDTERQVAANVMEALREYGVRGIPWSDREHVLLELAA
jgi:hypothetical protein